MTVRLIATDLDGTLLHSDGSVSARSRAALAAAEAAGFVVAFVTGRPPRWLDDLVEPTGHVGIAVGANGAVLYDLATQRTLVEHALAPELLRELARDLRASFPDVGFAVEHGHGFAAEPGYTHDWDVNPRLDRAGQPVPPPLIGDLDEITARPGIKLLAKDRGANPDAFMAAAARVLDGRATITRSSSYGLLEIAAHGVTKASGLAELAARHGIAREDVLAVGDMPNDLPMLQWAGHAYAVGNAHPDVRAAADAVLARNDDDAVAELIENLLAGAPV